MLKIFTIAAGFTFVLSILTVFAHDNIARLERKDALEELLHATQKRNLSEIQQGYKRLGSFRVWVPSLKSQASFDSCDGMQRSLEQLATRNEWNEWNRTWLEFTEQRCEPQR